MNATSLSGQSPLTGYFEEIKTNKIRPPLTLLRTDACPIEELVSSILQKGLLEPIVVRPSEGLFEVVAGNRRLEACRRLRFRKIPCHVVELTDKEAFEVSLIENLQRKTMNPFEEGYAFKRYVEEFGYGGISELAKKIGKSQPYVSRRVALTSLPDELKEKVMRRRISTSMIEELVPLDEENRAELAELITESKTITRAEVRELARYMTSNRRKYQNNGKRREVSYYQQIEMRRRLIDRMLARCIASLKSNMGRFDDAIDSLKDGDEETWIILDALEWSRRIMNKQVDDLLRLRKKYISGGHKLHPNMCLTASGIANSEGSSLQS